MCKDEHNIYTSFSILEIDGCLVGLQVRKRCRVTLGTLEMEVIYVHDKMKEVC